jgi:hypothetical protein
LDIRNLQDKFRDLTDRLPQERGDKVKLLAVVCLLPILLIWLIIYAMSSMPEPLAQAVDSPGWTIAQDLSRKLNADHAFMDVGFAVVTEDPLRFAVNGAVHSDADMPRLVEKLQELRPEGDYEMNVEVLRPHP